MTHQLKNGIITVSIAEKGAELQSIVVDNTGIEYMWGADPTFWAKKSPVLFPIVGGLKNNQYRYGGKTHTLGRHGFARDMDFTVTEQSSATITFTLAESAETLDKYPFAFKFSVKYVLNGSQLSVSYLVQNTDDKTLLFSVGAHPAFKVPMAEGTVFEDYYLKFSHVEHAGTWPLSPGGQIENYTTPLLENTDVLTLTKQLFYKDALVFKNLASNAISILSNKTPHGLRVLFDGFPYMGIWNAKDAKLDMVLNLGVVLPIV